MKERIGWRIHVVREFEHQDRSFGLRVTMQTRLSDLTDYYYSIKEGTSQHLCRDQRPSAKSLNKDFAVDCIPEVFQGTAISRPPPLWKDSASVNQLRPISFTACQVERAIDGCSARNAG